MFTILVHKEKRAQCHIKCEEILKFENELYLSAFTSIFCDFYLPVFMENFTELIGS